MGCQIDFEESNDGKYLLLQKCFDEFDCEDNLCYLECSERDFIGHYSSLKTKLSRKSFEIFFDNNFIKIEFTITDKKFKEFKKVLEIILNGISIIEYIL